MSIGALCEGKWKDYTAPTSVFITHALILHFCELGEIYFCHKISLLPLEWQASTSEIGHVEALQNF